MRLIVGSKSEKKLTAVHAALQRNGVIAEVVGVDTDSGVRTQPLESETETGARNRARNAQATDPASWGVGIESGLFRSGDLWLDKAVVVLRAPDGHEWVHLSDPVVFPTDAVGEAERRGFDTHTAGSVIAEKTGCDPTDPHLYLNSISRTQYLTWALEALFRGHLPGCEEKK